MDEGKVEEFSKIQNRQPRLKRTVSSHVEAVLTLKPGYWFPRPKSKVFRSGCTTRNQGVPCSFPCESFPFSHSVSHLCFCKLSNRSKMSCSLCHHGFSFFHPFFPLSPQPRPPASSWKKLEESREYTNGNTLREYQLEGVNWLLFNWYNRYLSHTGAYYTPWSPVAKCILKPQSNWIDFTG